MSNEERYAEFVAAYENLCHRLGFQINAAVAVEMLGPVVQCRGKVVVEPIANWTPPKEPEQQSASADTPTYNPDTDVMELTVNGRKHKEKIDA